MKMSGQLSRPDSQTQKPRWPTKIKDLLGLISFGTGGGRGCAEGPEITFATIQ